MKSWASSQSDVIIGNRHFPPAILAWRSSDADSERTKGIWTLGKRRIERRHRSGKGRRRLFLFFFSSSEAERSILPECLSVLLIPNKPCIIVCVLLPDPDLIRFLESSSLCYIQNMHLYHHPYSIESQKVRLALEEKDVDYTSHHFNPLTGKNMDSFFFRMNPSAKLPVFQNGSHILFQTIDIIQYIDRLATVSNGKSTAPINAQVMNWMEKIDAWDPKIFTLSHIPKTYNRFVSRFIRRVIISRMADSPDLASVYHVKLRAIYDTEDRLMHPDFLEQSREKLNILLNDAEVQLNETTYLTGEDFTMADCMFLPVLARLSLLNLDDEYINCRPKIGEYYKTVKQRQSYKLVIGRHFLGWRKYRTLLKTSLFLAVRSILKRY